MTTYGADYNAELENTTREDNNTIEYNNKVAVKTHTDNVNKLKGDDKTDELIQGGITAVAEGKNVAQLKTAYTALKSGQKTVGEVMGSKGAVIDGIRRLKNKATGEAPNTRDGPPESPGEADPTTVADDAGQTSAPAEAPGPENQGVEEPAPAPAPEPAEPAPAEPAPADDPAPAAGAGEDLSLLKNGTGAAEEAGAGLAASAGKATLAVGGKLLGNIGGAIDVVKDFEAVKKGGISQIFAGSGTSALDETGNALQVVGGLMDVTGIGAPLGALMSGIGGVVGELGQMQDDKDKEGAATNAPVPQATTFASANIGSLGGIASAQVNPMHMITGSGAF